MDPPLAGLCSSAATTEGRNAISFASDLLVIVTCETKRWTFTSFDVDAFANMLWLWRLTFDIQDLTRSPVGAIEYSL